MPADVGRLQRLLGGPELAELRRRLRSRFERGALQDEFTLAHLTAAERRAIADLLGRRAAVAGSIRIRGSALDEAFSRAGLAGSLREALEVLDGPIVERKAARLANDEAWRTLLAGIEHPRLRALADDVAGVALLKRFAGGDSRLASEMLSLTSRVIDRLPERGMPLAQLAARVLGDSHALDAGRPVAALVLRAFGLDLPADEAERSRDQWARLGVTVSELAAPVLCLNLPVSGGSRSANLIRAAAGEPVHLTLRTLLRDPPQWDLKGRRVFVCENPSIVSIAADSLGNRCAPLVCTSGMPGAAQQTLLRQMKAHGALLFYHGDFDWPGVRIGNFVVRDLQASTWRFSTADYDAACTDVSGTLPDGERVEALWDDQLASAMFSRGRTVHEEAVAELLLTDLSCG